MAGADFAQCHLSWPGGCQQTSAPVRRVVAVGGKPPLHHKVGESLHALTGGAQQPGDMGHGPRLRSHRIEDLPLRGAQAGSLSQLVQERDELAVQMEHGDGGAAEGVDGAHAIMVFPAGCRSTHNVPLRQKVAH